MADTELRILVSTAQGQKELDRFIKKLKQTEKAGDDTAKSFSKFKPAGKGLNNIAAGASSATSAMRGLVAAATAFATIGLGKAIFDTVSGFQSMKLQLKTLLGDMDAANDAFMALQDFATRTPFTLDQSVKGFQKLLALGLNPTESAMTSFGNTASAMGKDLNQMVEAVADATTFEFERLKEFGIKARQETDSVKFTFQGVTTEVAKNSQAIQQYLEGIGNTQFAGAMADQMTGLAGQTANLEDAWSKFKYEVGKGLESTTILNDLAAALLKGREWIHEFIAGWKMLQAYVTRALGKIEVNFRKFVLMLNRGWTGFTRFFQDALVDLNGAFGYFVASIIDGWSSVVSLWDDDAATSLQNLASNMRNVAQQRLKDWEAEKRAQDEAFANEEKRIESTEAAYDKAFENRLTKIAAQKKASLDALKGAVKSIDDIVPKNTGKAEQTLSEAHKTLGKDIDASIKKLQDFKKQVEGEKIKTGSVSDLLYQKQKIQGLIARGDIESLKEAETILAKVSTAVKDVYDAQKYSMDKDYILNTLTTQFEQLGETLKNTKIEPEVTVSPKMNIVPNTEALKNSVESNVVQIQDYLNSKNVEFTAKISGKVQTGDGAEMRLADVLTDKTWTHTVNVVYRQVNKAPAGVGGGSSTVQQTVGTRKSGA